MCHQVSSGVQLSIPLPDLHQYDGLFIFPLDLQDRSSLCHDAHRASCIECLRGQVQEVLKEALESFRSTFA